MQRFAFLIYGTLCYFAAMASFVYLGASLANIYVPNSIDATPTTAFGLALAGNIALVALFGLQHSIMARPWFKRWLTQFVPAPIERSTYVLLSTAALCLLVYAWQPLGGTLWEVNSPLGRGLLYGVYGLGWAIVVSTTFLINHFDLFGLRQVFLHFRGKEYTWLPFTTPGPYKLVRHPLYIGWFTVFWATPVMTLGHFVIAGTISAYILAAIRYEERDLVTYHGKFYADYRKMVPMLIPQFRVKKPAEAKDDHYIPTR